MRISFESLAMWENPIRNFVRRVKLRDEVLVNKVANEEGDGRRMGNLTMTYEVLGSLALTESFPCLVFTRFDQNVKYSFPLYVCTFKFIDCENTVLSIHINSPLASSIAGPLAAPETHGPLGVMNKLP